MAEIQVMEEPNLGFSVVYEAGAEDEEALSKALVRMEEQLSSPGTRAGTAGRWHPRHAKH